MSARPQRPGSWAVTRIRGVLTGSTIVRQAAMLLLSGVFLTLAVLAYVDLLEFTVPTSYAFVAQAANGDFWMYLHAAVGLFVLAAVCRPRLYRQAMSAAAGFMFVWSFFNLIWGLSTVNGQPVSLAGPVLGGALAGGAFIMALAPLPPSGGASS